MKQSLVVPDANHIDNDENSIRHCKDTKGDDNVQHSSVKVVVLCPPRSVEIVSSLCGHPVNMEAYEAVIYHQYEYWKYESDGYERDMILKHCIHVGPHRSTFVVNNASLVDVREGANNCTAVDDYDDVCYTFWGPARLFQINCCPK